MQPGNIIDGKYRIVRLLGEGGMGAVYEGENTRIHRRVAIKVLHESVAAKAEVVQRFEREAQAAGRIGSEHIVEVLDLGNLPSGERFMVMEFLEGESLGDRIKSRKRLGPFEAAPIIHQLLEGLAAAHQAGIIHRDLKPDNVFLITSRKGQRDFVKVLDFGVSKFSVLDSDMSMTKTGAVMGTPYYMSPEQARGSKVDHRSDLYSVGVVMYQAITGRLPFNAETFNELVFKIALENAEPAELVVPNLDPSFAQIIARSMVRDANGRFQTAQEFQAVVQDWMMRNMSPQEFAMALGGGALAATAQRGLPMVQLPTGQMGMGPQGPLAQSQLGAQQQMARSQAGPMGTSQVGPLGTSQPGPMGTSQPGMMGTPQPGMMGTPQPGMMGTSQPNALSTSHQQLGGSQAGLAVTSPPARKSGALIAVALGAVVVLGAGAFGAYKFFGAPAGAGPAETGAPVVTNAPTSTAAPATTATAAPTQTATAEPTAEPTTEPINLDEPDPKAPVGKNTGKIPGTKPTGKATSAPTTKPTGKATARPVSTEL